LSPLPPADGNEHGDGDGLLRPRETAEVLGVRPATVARWARAGRLTTAWVTPGGHRRYRLTDVRRLLAGPPHADVAEDAARLYDQGWSVRQGSAKFDLGYQAARRLLRQHVTLRPRGGPH
jgi:excisionase family DNA binding protein